MATSSEVIEAMLAARGTTIEQCDLLLRRYPTGPNSYNQRVDYAIAEWQALKASGAIQQLAIARYEFVPSEYQVIVDDKAVIFGAYVYRPDEPAEADFSPPSLVHNVSAEASALIRRFIEAFDSNHAAWRTAGISDSATANSTSTSGSPVPTDGQ
jgi:hypothetical protein